MHPAGIIASSLRRGRYALYFPGGSSSGVTTSISALPFQTGPFTIELWFNIPAATATAFGDLCGNYDSAGWLLQYSLPATSIYFLIFDTTLAVQGATAPVAFVPDSLWHHLAVCYDPSITTVSLYLDGTLANTFALTDVNPITDAFFLGIGGAYSQASIFFNGTLQMLRISNVVKYSGTFTPSTTYGIETDTVLYYNIGEDGAATTTAGRDNTGANVLPYALTGPLWVAGHS